MSGIDALLKNKMAKVTSGKTEENTLNLNPEFDDDKPIVESGKGRRQQDEGQWEDAPTGQSGLSFGGKFTVKSKEEAEKNKRKAQQQQGPVESTWDADMKATVLNQEEKKEADGKPKKTGAGVLSAAQGKKGATIMRPSQAMNETYFPALGEEPPARPAEPVEAPKQGGWDDAPQPTTDADGKPRFVNKKKVGGGPIDTITPIEEAKPAADEKKTEEFTAPMKFTSSKTAGGNFKPLEQNKTREEKEKAIEAELTAKREAAIAQRKKDEEIRTAQLLNRDEKKVETKPVEEPSAEFEKPVFKTSKKVNNNIQSELASEKYDTEKAKRDAEKAEREKEKTEKAEKGEKHERNDKHGERPKREPKKEEKPKPAPKVEAPKEEEEKPKVEKPNALGKFVPHEQHGVAHLAGWD